MEAVESPLVAVESAADRLGVVGRPVDAVESRGKHLLIRFEGGAALHTHLRMHGRWRVRRGEPLRTAGARAVVRVSGAVAACWRAPVVELLSRMQVADHPALRRLGPDLLAPGFDAEVARRRLRARAALPIAEALLDQTALAGIGNVYKSEVLHLCGVDPFARVADLDDATLARLIDTARVQLRRNRGRLERRTTTALAPVPLAVYGRARQACRRCGAAIRRAVHGELPRATWWCPSCQPVRDAGRAAAPGVSAPHTGEEAP